MKKPTQAFQANTCKALFCSYAIVSINWVTCMSLSQMIWVSEGVQTGRFTHLLL